MSNVKTHKMFVKYILANCYYINANFPKALEKILECQELSTFIVMERSHSNLLLVKKTIQIYNQTNRSKEAYEIGKKSLSILNTYKCKSCKEMAALNRELAVTAFCLGQYD